MAEFGQNQYVPLDRAYYAENPEPNRRTDDIEEPIFPASSIGITVPDVDPAGRNRNVIEAVDAAFRGGAGNIQLMLMGRGGAGGMGGGPKSHGYEVREAIRELQKVAGAHITGVELPNHILNLSGMTQQGFSEEARHHQLEEVKDAIKFIGDIAGGGHVNVISWEFTRNLQDAPLSEKEKQMFKMREEPVAQVVNEDTGQVHPIRKGELYPMNYDLNTLEPLEQGQKPQMFDWEKISKLADKYGEGESKKSPELFVWQKLRVENKVMDAQGSIAHYRRLLRDVDEHIDRLKQIKKENPEQFERNSRIYEEMLEEKKGYQNAINSMEIGIEELKKEGQEYRPVKEYALGKAADSYAEAGIWAWQESMKNHFVKQGKGMVNVGPEIGWSREFYGSHPKEWIELIKESRKEMVERLTEKEIDGKPNPYYDSSVSEKEAENLAKQHIKGEFDTAHLGSWLQYFKPELPWDERIKEFKKWYKDQIEYVAKENKEHDLINSVQIVDSASGQHAHLPPGQGILGEDIYEYMKILKEKGGYKGEFTSEGHEEEQLGQGRILSKAWDTFGSHVMLPYVSGGAPQRMTDIRHAQARIPYGTNQIYQSYVPSNDFALWSQVPLE
ncbi:hypothetical protein JXB27_01135 [Candidatus Woesearchaeota archaeon]|nr:hypothetical protein [Candidatus Woesearchaeota archaeon]